MPVPCYMALLKIGVTEYIETIALNSFKLKIKFKGKCSRYSNFEHLKVNYLLHFVYPDTGAHNNKTESTLRALKKSLPVS